MVEQIKNYVDLIDTLDFLDDFLSNKPGSLYLIMRGHYNSATLNYCILRILTINEEYEYCGKIKEIIQQEEIEYNNYILSVEPGASNLLSQKRDNLIEEINKMDINVIQRFLTSKLKLKIC